LILEGSPAGNIEPKKPVLGRLVLSPTAGMARSHKTARSGWSLNTKINACNT